MDTGSDIQPERRDRDGSIGGDRRLFHQVRQPHAFHVDQRRYRPSGQPRPGARLPRNRRPDLFRIRATKSPRSFRKIESDLRNMYVLGFTPPGRCARRQVSQAGCDDHSPGSCQFAPAPAIGREGSQTEKPCTNQRYALVKLHKREVNMVTCGCGTGCAASSLAPQFAADDVVSGVAATVKAVDKGTKTVVVKTADGTEQRFILSAEPSRTARKPLPKEARTRLRA